MATSKNEGIQKRYIYFFAGHGLASDNGEDLYVLPHDETQFY